MLCYGACQCGKSVSLQFCNFFSAIKNTVREFTIHGIFIFAYFFSLLRFVRHKKRNACVTSKNNVMYTYKENGPKNGSGGVKDGHKTVRQSHSKK